MPILDSQTMQPRRVYSTEELEAAAQEMRAWVTIALQAAGSGHLGGTMSIADVAAALYLQHINHDPYDPRWEGRDRVFWSAGHKAPMIYAALGMAGYLDDMPVAYHGEPIERYLEDRPPDEIDVVGIVGDLVVSDEEEALVLVLQAYPVLQGARIMPKM